MQIILHLSSCGSGAARASRPAAPHASAPSRVAPAAAPPARLSLPHRAAAPARRCLRVAASAGEQAGVSPEEAFCLANFRPWVLDLDGARRCLTFLRDKERRVFSVAKATVVMDSLREDHAKRFPPEMGVPFDLPKTWPGMQHVLQRCSDPL